MNVLPTPKVVEAEQYEGGVIITFEDGSCAVYPAELLYASKNLATVMSELRCRPEEAAATPANEEPSID